jgi:hypothetical protein
LPTGAASLQPSVGATPDDPAAAVGAPNSSAAAYNQAATSDPYNQSDFSSQQSFGLVASQMLGAAAACEQLHADSVSLGALQTAKAAKDTGTNRADLDAAQQHMLDPRGDGVGHAERGCCRLRSRFGFLQ